MDRQRITLYYHTNNTLRNNHSHDQQHQALMIETKRLNKFTLCWNTPRSISNSLRPHSSESAVTGSEVTNTCKLMHKDAICIQIRLFLFFSFSRRCKIVCNLTFSFLSQCIRSLTVYWRSSLQSRLTSNGWTPWWTAVSSRSGSKHFLYFF